MLAEIMNIAVKVSGDDDKEGIEFCEVYAMGGGRGTKFEGHWGVKNGEGDGAGPSKGG